MTRSLLISAAAIAALVASTEVQALDRSLTMVAVHSGGGDRDHHWRGHNRVFPDAVSNGNGCISRNDRGRHGHDRGGRSGCSGYGGDYWGYYNPDFNRSWDSDSYNDWWHDRPDRAFPRWVQQQHNEGCDPDRMWWSGSGWHC